MRPQRQGLQVPAPVPSAILEANDPHVYSAFIRGLFEADGTVLDGVPSFTTAHESFAAEIRTLLLTKGLATTTRTTASGSGGPIYQVRSQCGPRAELRRDHRVHRPAQGQPDRRGGAGQSAAAISAQILDAARHRRMAGRETAEEVPRWLVLTTAFRFRAAISKRMA